MHLGYPRADALGGKLGARALEWVQVGYGYIKLDPGAPTPPGGKKGVQDGCTPSMHPGVGASANTKKDFFSLSDAR